MPEGKQSGESLLLSAALNIFLPIIILTRLTGDGLLGPTNGFLLAMSMPVAYGAYDFLRRRKVNALSAIGLAGVGLTAAIGTMGLDPSLVAVKEAAVPLAIGAAVAASTRTRWHFSRKLSERAVYMDKVHASAERRGNGRALRGALDVSNFMVAGTFVLSAALNYALATAIVKSQPGTVAFNEELGSLAALSMPAIALPSLAVIGMVAWWFLSRASRLSGMKIEDMIRK